MSKENPNDGQRTEAENRDPTAISDLPQVTARLGAVEIEETTDERKKLMHHTLYCHYLMYDSKPLRR